MRAVTASNIPGQTKGGIMKSLIFISTVLLAANVFAKTCQEKAEAAALKEAKNPKSETVWWEVDTASTQLLSQKGQALEYKVTIMSGYADFTESGEFADEYYVVKATGTTASCKVQQVDYLGSESFE